MRNTEPRGWRLNEPTTNEHISLRKNNMSGIFECLHCSNRYTTALKNGLCKFCNLPEKRAKLDEENTEIYKQSKMKYVCNYCEKERRDNERKMAG